ncbi:MAG: metalloregulator ArsR/SmtB family transcription factor [Bacteroidota bacterium]
MAKITCIRSEANLNQIKECQQVIKNFTKEIHTLSNIFMLIGNDVRLKILFLLEKEKELCPCDIADILGMTVPAISQHLRKLKDGHLIQSRRKGQTIYYSLNNTHLNIIKPIFKYIQYSKKQL